MFISLSTNSTIFMKLQHFLTEWNIERYLGARRNVLHKVRHAYTDIKTEFVECFVLSLVGPIFLCGGREFGKFSQCQW